MKLSIHPRSIYLNNKVIIISIFMSLLCYSIYIFFRGFGWDGDSFISASQYQKLIGSDLYGMIDGAAHPKILSVLLFGIVYQFFGGFYFLTLLAIFLNTLMITTITSWVNQEKGLWLIALFGLLINIPWTKIVVNCDNPAFSIPFIIFGLYKISKDKIIFGAILLTISSLFRSGAEFIIILIFIQQLLKNNLKSTMVLGLAFVVSAIHTYWGYFLIYQTKELLWELSWNRAITTENIEKYQYSLNAFMPYLSSIIRQIFNKYSILFIVPSIFGIAKLLKTKASIRLIILTPLESLIIPLGLFVYGIYNVNSYQHMGYTLLLPVIAAFSIKHSFIEKIRFKTKIFFTSVILILVVLFSAFTGNLKKGDYESHTNGTGLIGWTSFPDIKHDIESTFPSKKVNILTAYQYLTFVILDVGTYAANIDIIYNETDIDYSVISQYSLIVIPNEWEMDLKLMLNLGYVIKSNKNNSYIYYISNLLL